MSTAILSPTRKRIKRNDTTSVTLRELETIVRGINPTPAFPVPREVGDSLARHYDANWVHVESIEQYARIPSLTTKHLKAAEEAASRSVDEDWRGFNSHMMTGAIAACMEFLKASSLNDTSRAIDWLQYLQVFCAPHHASPSANEPPEESPDEAPEFVWDKAFYKAFRKAEEFSK